MAFAPSKDLIDAGRAIYVYGSLGVITRIFTVKFDKIPGLDLPIGLTTDAVLTPAGVLGIVVIFRTVSFGLRAAAEIISQSLARLEATHAVLQTAQSLADITPRLPAAPDVQPLALASERRIGRYRRLRSITSSASGIVEVVFPFMFGIAAMVVLWAPSFALFQEAVRRVWGVLF